MVGTAAPGELPGLVVEAEYSRIGSPTRRPPNGKDLDQNQRRAHAQGAQAKAAVQPAPKTETKQALVLAMLRRQDGASIAEIVDATDWQPHSARAFLTGAVKKRLEITLISEKGEDGIRRYYVVPLAP
jgi:hypothetical protein